MILNDCCCFLFVWNFPKPEVPPIILNVGSCFYGKEAIRGKGEYCGILD